MRVICTFVPPLAGGEIHDAKGSYPELDSRDNYNKSRAVDEPFIATLSEESNWLVASFAREAGNVWTNPALTCQHVDPQTSLAPRKRVILERKILILRGSLDDALKKARQQRKSLK